ncbi:family 78 glycoside hydrolase catalytic domain [Dickeya chrysanthemi]|uniref:family 78 glycoside hydrolase catalytic domain n=1 Tax=Dickeya chrysanthemi TaxID=556 RepID=UPI0009DE5746|nr:family 78 glycoside hydrolase catalytic domain [Dickeya chrysanthemi]
MVSITKPMLRINCKSNSIVVDKLPLHLSWSVDFKQKAYEVSVIKNDKVIYFAEQASNNTVLMIDSFELDKNSEYVVEVCAYNQDEQYEILKNTFKTGNFGNFTGQWISGGKTLATESDYYLENRNSILKKVFVVDQGIVDSNINIVGLGYYKLYINGEEVGDSELNTDWTNYNETVYYDTYDVNRYLKKGDNEILIELGNGWFNPAPLTLFGKYNLRNVLSIGEPQAIADLVIKYAKETVTVSSDESWEVCDGPYLFNNIYLGEVLDFRLIKGQNTFLVTKPVWRPVVINHGPRGRLIPSFIPKIKKSAQLTPHHIHVVDENEIIVDFGEVLTGFIDITLAAYDAQEIELIYSEEINNDYTLQTDSTLAGFIGEEVDNGVVIPGGPGAPHRAEQKDKIICKNGFNRFLNKFTYHSFRYMQIKGLTLDQIHDVRAVYVHTDLAENGTFNCSDVYLNKLLKTGNITKLNNIHSVFSDCARERFAYGGDIVALANSQVYQFETASLYEKTIYDFVDDIRLNGGFPETAPFVGIKTNGTGEEAGPLGWQLAFSYLLNIHYRHYGNLQLIKDMFPYFEKQVIYLNGFNLDELSLCCLGDWGSRDKNSEDYKSSSPAIRFTTACFYYFHILLMAKFSTYLSFDEKSEFYLSQASALKNKIINRYRNTDGSFSDKSQTSYIFAVYFNLVDDISDAVNQLVALIRNNNYVMRCGIFGQSFSYEILRQHGHNDVVYHWLNSEDGFKSMLGSEYRTLKEYFGDNKHGSCNHAMFSSYISWLYQGLGGISIQEHAIASDQVFISPFIIDSLDYVECEYQSVRGLISCKWHRVEAHVELVIKVPFNLKGCMLSLDKRYNIHVNNVIEIYSDESKRYFDITDMGEVEIILTPALH